MRTRATIGILATAAVVAAALVYGFLPRPLPVDISEAKRAPLAVTVEEEGKTRVRERYVISAPVAGHLRRIELDAGDEVGAGQMLAVIEPARAGALDPRARAQAEASVRAAGAAMAVAEDRAREAAAAARLARQERERLAALREANFVSAQALDAAVSAQARAEAAQAAAEHAVRVARFERDTAHAAAASAARLQAGRAAERFALKSPVAARVLRVLSESEGAVAPGQPLLEIGNPDSLEVEVEVLSTQAVRIAPGAKVVLDRWGGDAAIAGRVRVVEPGGFTKISALGVEEQRVRVIVDLVSPRESWQRLGDGYRVEARFVLWEGEQVLQVPTSALFRHGPGWALFAVNGGRAVLTPVEVGKRAGLASEVLSGIEAGARIVSHPDDRIVDGTRVKPR